MFIFVGIGTSIDISLPVDDVGLTISNFSYTAFNLVIGIMAALQKDIYPTKEKIIENDTENQMNEVVKNYNISTSTYKQLKEELNFLMENEKPYRNPELRIDSIAKILGTNRTYLSLIIKEDSNRTFIEWVNYYRIEEAKQLIIRMDNRSSFADIAEQIGFKSISSFNTFFKRFTGKTPTEYKKSYMIIE